MIAEITGKGTIASNFVDHGSRERAGQANRLGSHSRLEDCYGEDGSEGSGLRGLRHAADVLLRDMPWPGSRIENIAGEEARGEEGVEGERRRASEAEDGMTKPIEDPFNNPIQALGVVRFERREKPVIDPTLAKMTKGEREEILAARKDERQAERAARPPKPKLDRAARNARRAEKAARKARAAAYLELHIALAKIKAQIAEEQEREAEINRGQERTKAVLMLQDWLARDGKTHPAKLLARDLLAGRDARGGLLEYLAAAAAESRAQQERAAWARKRAALVRGDDMLRFCALVGVTDRQMHAWLVNEILDGGKRTGAVQRAAGAVALNIDGKTFAELVTKVDAKLDEHGGRRYLRDVLGTYLGLVSDAAGAMTEAQYDRMIGPAMPKGTRSGGNTVAPGAREGAVGGAGRGGRRTLPKKVSYGAGDRHGEG
jgi:hypothetical protein